MPSFRIRTHLIFYLSAITFLLTAAIVTLYTVRFKEYALNSLSEYGKKITQDISFAVADHIITENFAALQDFVREFSALPNVNAIEISDPAWTMLAATDINRLGTRMSDDSQDEHPRRDDTLHVCLEAGSGQLIITNPIYVENILMGHARVFLSLREMLVHIADVQKKGVLTGILFWLIAVFFGIFVSRRLSRPMQSLMQATESISQGDFNVTLPAPKLIFELEKFSRALGVMAHTIEVREIALRNSEKKFRHLFERAMEGIFVCDQHGAFADINPAMLDILGYSTKEELLARNLFAEIFADREAVAVFQNTIRDHFFLKGYEVRLLQKDGSPVIASLSCQAVMNDQGHIIKYEGMLRDITTQQQAAEEIARMRNYLNNIIESMPSMLIAIDEDARITQWNSAAIEATGITSGEAIGRKIWEIAPFFNKYTEHFKRITMDQQPIKLHRELMTDHGEKTYNLTLFPLVANGSKGIAIRLDDITELEMKEKQLRQAQKMESVGTLAGGLAHDFNNVLGGILGNLSLMQFRLDNNDHMPASELREYLDRMSSAGYRAADLVRQLLTLSSKQPIKRVPVDLNLSIKHVRKIGENTFDKSVKIEVRQPQTPAYAMADPTQIEQVLLNLCINAVHAMTIMREGTPWGGTLAMSVEQVTADAAFRKYHPEAIQGLYWKISIGDTGVGMDTNTVSKIFDPFFTTKGSAKGTGLGLTMVYNIIKQLEGFIDVYSEPGLGSTFSVYVPVLDRTVHREEALEKTSIPRGDECLLVIDDDKIMRETTCSILESAGYTVLSAKDGQEGAEIYREKQSSIAAVILDMVMPVMSGKEAYIQLKEINPAVKVLLVSGFRHDSRVDEVMQLGVNAFLQKPFTLENLSRTVREIIDA
ncbi:MAG: PAS domain S-box protein [Thermodesulfobacteriota bacterium]